MWDKRKSIFFAAVDDDPPEALKPEEHYRSFRLNSTQAMGRRYGVRIHYYEPGMEEAKRDLSFELALELRPDEAHASSIMVHIHKRQLYINRHMPDLVSECLAAMVMESLYPIVVRVPSEAELSPSISNRSEIQARWQQMKVRIRKKYEGFISERYLQLVDQQLASESRLAAAMEKDLCWKAMFMPIYGLYPESLTRPTTLQFPVYPKRYCSFSGTAQVDRAETDFGCYGWHFNGINTKLGTLKAVVYIDVNSGLGRFYDITFEGLAGDRLRFKAHQISAMSYEAVLPESTEKNSIWENIENYRARKYPISFK